MGSPEVDDGVVAAHVFGAGCFATALLPEAPAEGTSSPNSGICKSSLSCGPGCSAAGSVWPEKELRLGAAGAGGEAVEVGEGHRGVHASPGCAALGAPFGGCAWGSPSVEVGARIRTDTRAPPGSTRGK